MLQVLFDNIRDKSKVQPSSEVFKIEELDRGVQVALKDGSTVRGDIVVGADGVHSSVRAELWRIADIETSSYNLTRLSKCNEGAYCIL